MAGGLGENTRELLGDLYDELVALNCSPDEIAEICESISSGSQINAIKTLRAASGLGLTEAQQIVQQIADATHNTFSPEVGGSWGEVSGSWGFLVLFAIGLIAMKQC